MSMSKFVGQCVVMGVKARPSQDGKRMFRNAVLYFEEDTSTLEASISEDHEHLYQASSEAGRDRSPVGDHGEYAGVQRATVLPVALGIGWHMHRFPGSGRVIDSLIRTCRRLALNNN